MRGWLGDLVLVARHKSGRRVGERRRRQPVLYMKPGRDRGFRLHQVSIVPLAVVRSMLRCHPRRSLGGWAGMYVVLGRRVCAAGVE